MRGVCNKIPFWHELAAGVRSFGAVAAVTCWWSVCSFKFHKLVKIRRRTQFDMVKGWMFKEKVSHALMVAN